MIAGVLAACVMIAAGAGLASGRLTIPFDLNAHAVGWLNFLVVTPIVPFVMLHAIGRFDRVADLTPLADEAMSRAKRSGRNRYCIAEAMVVEAV